MLAAGTSDKWDTALLKLRTSWEFYKSPVVGKPQGSTLKEKVHNPSSRLAGSRQQTKRIQGFPCQLWESLVDAVSRPRNCRPGEVVILGLMTAKVQHSY